MMKTKLITENEEVKVFKFEETDLMEAIIDIPGKNTKIVFLNYIVDIIDTIDEKEVEETVNKKQFDYAVRIGALYARELINHEKNKK